MKMKKIILDANVLIESTKSGTDIFGQIKDAFPKSEIITSKSVSGELRKISKGKGKDATAARIALLLSDKNLVGLKKTKSRGDDSLIELCDENSILITQDKKLREKCAKKGFLTGYLRGKRQLAVA